MTPSQRRTKMKANLLKAREELGRLSPAKRPRTAEELIQRVRRTREKIWEEKLASHS